MTDVPPGSGANSVISAGFYTDAEACPACRGPMAVPIHDSCRWCAAKKTIWQSDDERISAVSSCSYPRGHGGQHSWEIEDPSGGVA